jgi:predicted DNA-binding transcriptional regulator AlpA
MPEFDNSETKQTDEASAILAGYLKLEELAKALDVSERTIARWHHFREGPPRVQIGRKVYYRLESVNAWIASCERPEPRAGRARRPRPRTTDPSSVAISAKGHNVSPLPGSSGGDD